MSDNFLAAEYRLARERLAQLAAEALRREAAFRALADLMDEADDALDIDTYEQRCRDEPDDAKCWIRAGTERKCAKVFTEIDRLRHSMSGSHGMSDCSGGPVPHGTSAYVNQPTLSAQARALSIAVKALERVEREIDSGPCSAFIKDELARIRVLVPSIDE